MPSSIKCIFFTEIPPRPRIHLIFIAWWQCQVNSSQQATHPTRSAPPHHIPIVWVNPSKTNIEGSTRRPYFIWLGELVRWLSTTVNSGQWVCLDELTLHAWRRLLFESKSNVLEVGDSSLLANTNQFPHLTIKLLQSALNTTTLEILKQCPFPNNCWETETWKTETKRGLLCLSTRITFKIFFSNLSETTAIKNISHPMYEKVY